MALQTTGAIQFDDIQTEFGGTNPIAINEYYRGGTFVPNISENNGIPTSGAISLNNFYGGMKTVVITVTEGTQFVGAPINITYYGYNSGFAIGSRSPTTYNGQSLNVINYVVATASTSFTISMPGSLTQGFFTSVTPSGASALTSASATFSSNATVSSWSWSSVTKPASWDGTGTSTVTFA